MIGHLPSPTSSNGVLVGSWSFRQHKKLHKQAQASFAGLELILSRSTTSKAFRKHNKQAFTMGCTASKQTVQSFGRIDDSVHVMLEHDKKVAQRHGVKCHQAYVPRKAHPLLKSSIQAEEEEEEKTVDDSFRDMNEEQARQESERLLFHTKNHCDTVDERDLPRRVHIHVPAVARA